MARTKISEFSATANSNTDINSINIAEGCAPSNINDAIRELMAELKDFQAGTKGDSFNGPVGTTTAAAGAFTTLSSTGNTTLGDASGDTVTINGTATFANANPTLSAGTANGVLYLNGSKVATSGSALTFDGTNFATTGNVTGATLKTTRASGAQPEVVLTQTGVASWSIYNPPSSTDLRFYNGSDLVTFASSGNIGIGTTSPDSGISSTQRVLEVANSNVAALTLNNTGARKYTVYSGVAGQLSFYDITGGSERMRITSGGDVGIGTSSPGSKLEVAAPSSNGAVSNGIAVTNAGSGSGTGSSLFLGYGTTTGKYGSISGFYDGTGTALTFGTSPTASSAAVVERARIDSSGHLLVACTSVPGIGSSTTGAGLLSSGAITAHRAAATSCYFGRSNDGEVVALYSGTTQRGTISISGATTTYGSFSDYRLKENVAPLVGAVAKVMALKPSTFNFIEFPEQTINGFIAHEVAEVEPIAVTGAKDAIDGDGKAVYQSVDPAKLVPLLTAALQEAVAEINSLKARLDAANL